ncbi:hypothetical protein QTO17_25230, partial [Vibrio owensii]
ITNNGKMNHCYRHKRHSERNPKSCIPCPLHKMSRCSYAFFGYGKNPHFADVDAHVDIVRIGFERCYS